MIKEVYFENDFVQLVLNIFNNAELIIANIKKNEPTEEEWKEVLKNFENYYTEHLIQVKRKYIMILNVENLSLLPLGKIKDITNILKENKPLIKEYCQFTTLVVKSSLVKQILNLGLYLYKNEKPIFFENDFQKTYTSILEKITGDN